MKSGTHPDQGVLRSVLPIISLALSMVLLISGMSARAFQVGDLSEAQKRSLDKIAALGRLATASRAVLANANTSSADRRRLVNINVTVER